jgi:hypothetical protein
MMMTIIECRKINFFKNINDTINIKLLSGKIVPFHIIKYQLNIMYNQLFYKIINDVIVGNEQNDINDYNGIINTLFAKHSFLYPFLITPFFTEPKSASLAGALTYLVIWFVILILFDRKKMIFKV